jgi:hypothetical protein
VRTLGACARSGTHDKRNINATRRLDTRSLRMTASHP